MNEEWLTRYLSFKPPEEGEPYCDGEPPKRGFLCWLGFHRSICHNYICGHGFDTCNDCMRRV